MNRITFGVNSLLARLRATHNWHRLAQGYLQSSAAAGESP
jgi:hypothetical protein